ncbi:MAG: metal-dependent transcriptional regulator [Oscillospiraceae bacterium]|nr:metal-dependent transcriptional regulator [Oscillospiraceae bacterium]MBO5917324.1 metal-dependent transcriptional regulator [Oscillospiraceae bacterium]
MHLHQSGEDYLETILILRREKGVVRSIDVAQHMGFSKPSVSRAMSILRADGYIEMERSGGIRLTEEGERVARTMYERHDLLTRWLIGLGVSPETAAGDACRMEHALSEETFSCIKRYIGDGE